MKFTITDELKAAETVTMKDAAIEATISKVDITNAEKELPGAELQIMDTEGKEVVKTIFGEELKWDFRRNRKTDQGPARWRVYPPRDQSSDRFCSSARCEIYDKR